MKKNRQNIDSILKNLSTSKGLPKIIFVFILLLYLIIYKLLSGAARSPAVFMFMGNPVPFAIFTGVFSSMANICIIFMVVLFTKPGFITVLIISLYQFPVLTLSLIKGHSIASIPGLFSNIFIIFASTIIYLNNRKIEKYQERLRIQAITDPLTGLPNRFACTELMESLIKESEKFTAVSVGLNNFKSINDTMGHEVGDIVLKEVASRWKTLADSHHSDTIDFVSRIGGGEYFLIIRGCTPDKNIGTNIEEIINSYEKELEHKLTVNNCDYFLTASYGYAEFPTDADSSKTIFSYASAALHEIKNIDNSSKTLHFSSKLFKTEQILEMERKIRTALENDTVFFYLQPQYYASHKLRGFEVLARMKDADGTIIPPGNFIPVAEKVGLVDQIDSRVFRKAACFLAELLKKTDEHLILCTNVSVRHLMKNNFIEEIKDIVKESGVSPDHFEIEITESIMIDSAEKALQYINELKAMGMKIAIDDFGTGYSSLSYLQKFPADMLKIDKSFIDVMNTTDSSKKYVATIISIGHVLNLEVISEGVETDDQLETLKNIGCDYIQGFLWGRPMPPEEAAKLI